ncbi:MAG: EamA family transporter [Planctomycetes bacterium]|nr:EamA family transporter [Planctomycetota bacterium]
MKMLAGATWLPQALLALACWGLWGLLTKLAAGRVPWPSMLLAFGACSVLLGLISVRGEWGRADAHHLVALAAGFAGALGFLFFYRAIAAGPASTVIPITSLYVVVAAGLAVAFLAEPVSLRKLLGIGLAMAAVCLLAE